MPTSARFWRPAGSFNRLQRAGRPAGLGVPFAEDRPAHCRPGPTNARVPAEHRGGGGVLGLHAIAAGDGGRGLSETNGGGDRGGDRGGGRGAEDPGGGQELRGRAMLFASCVTGWIWGEDSIALLFVDTTS